jgi:hypothetical protein
MWSEWHTHTHTHTDTGHKSRSLTDIPVVRYCNGSQGGVLCCCYECDKATACVNR